MHGAVPSRPARPLAMGTIVTIRVVLILCSVFSCALLSCAPLLRIAYLRRGWYHWTAAGVSVPVTIGLFAVVGTQPEDSDATNISLSVLLALGAAVAVYYLALDIRHYERQRAWFVLYGDRAGAGSVPYPYGVPPQPGPGFPPPAGLAAPGGPVVHPAPTPPPFPTRAPGRIPPPPERAPAPPREAGALPGPSEHPRIDQVRAELDELSDLLRKDQDGR
jgi:hypothetical protein